MTKKLHVPRRVFFDTSHLIELTKVQRAEQVHINKWPDGRLQAYQQLLRLLRNGECLPVIGFGQPFEWVRNGVAEGHEIAGVLDASPACFECASDIYAWLLEVVAEAVRVSGRESPQIPPVIRDVRGADPVAEFMIRHLPAARSAAPFQPAGMIRARKFRSVRDVVDVAWTVAASDPVADDVYQTFCTGFIQTLQRMQFEQNRSRDAMIRRLRRLELIEDTLRGVVPHIDIERLWRDLDLERCRAARLWSRFWWRMVKNQRTPDRNDPTDIEMLPAYVYSDFSLTERRMCGHLIAADSALRGRVFREPSQLVAAVSL